MKIVYAAVLAAAVGFSATAQAAADFSFTGSFRADDDVQLFNFNVGALSNVTLRSWSYAGGTNAAGNSIARGGFDPILALFDSTGALIDQNDDGGPSNVATDFSGVAYDVFLTSSLAAGSYTVAVMQYDNFANGPNLSNGFLRTGEGNFTGGAGFDPACANVSSFCDVSGSAFNARTSLWAFDILNVESAATTVVPVPAALPLMAAGLGLFGLFARRRRSA